jgi:colanic acid/amylovoran biosynthesis glycosyltransferase
MSTDASPPPQCVMFITTSSPMSNEEPFVQDEITELVRQGHRVIIVPMRQRHRVPNAAAIAHGLAPHVRSARLLDLRVLIGAAVTILRQPVSCGRALVEVIRTSGGRRNLITNLTSFPKALWTAGIARRARVAHVHAYWLAHAATAAMIVGRLNHVPWSGTGYRWDIDAASCFQPKFCSAAFLRCADEFGETLLRAANERYGTSVPIHLVRTGVEVPDRSEWDSVPVDTTTICCAGAFVEKKGQALLIRALAALRTAGDSARLDLFGEGRCEPELRELTRANDLTDLVTFRGTVPLDELRRVLRRRPILVLPSIITADGQQEGIPVVLVEAMANGAPLISTTTGSIADLVVPGTGLLVDPGDVASLAEALHSSIADAAASDARARRAYDRVRSEFSLGATSAALWRHICEAPVHA